MVANVRELMDLPPDPSKAKIYVKLDKWVTGRTVLFEDLEPGVYTADMIRQLVDKRTHSWARDIRYLRDLSGEFHHIPFDRVDEEGRIPEDAEGETITEVRLEAGDAVYLRWHSQASP